MQYVIINTHEVHYFSTRRTFGVASAPAIFQKIMDTILQGLPNVICYIYDILVSGEDEASHFKSLEEVFNRLEKHGFNLKQENVASCSLVLNTSDTKSWKRNLAAG